MLTNLGKAGTHVHFGCWRQAIGDRSRWGVPASIPSCRRYGRCVGHNVATLALVTTAAVDLAITRGAITVAHRALPWPWYVVGRQQMRVVVTLFV